ncbi:probable APC/C activator protein CDC20 [Zygosaccharomyces bailii ISA1307]|nr:probable APC/C activator protein CDC20 [Zygosaccharomyces bailii ISA1307]
MVDAHDKSKLANNANRSVLSLTSPAKLNIISSAWSRCPEKVTKKPLKRATSLNSNQGRTSIYARPKISVATPPMLRRNSSFFKDDERPSSSSQQLEGEESHTDRFIPMLQGNSQNKVDPLALQEELPPPNASPSTHLRAQTKLVFKQTVAEACGLDMNQKILQYMPQPPVSSFRRQSYSMKRRTHYNYQQLQQQQQAPELMKLRKINTNPERILDAPGFQDDFYLNLLSWSAKNVLAIALETALYLWNGSSGDVTTLVDYETTMITSVVWSDDDCHISIGKDDGNTEIWDVETMSLVRTMRSGLGVRIGSQSWLETLVATGSRSGEIQINDVRIRQHVVSTWDEHSGEVCGLSYKSDGLQLASGGNDNTVMIWDTRVSMPQWVKRSHQAAVKAISWCPYVGNLLATGGGQTDKCIHFWNTTTGAKVSSISTGSQVSSLHWGQSYSSNGAMNKEIVATGGNPGNAVSVYNYDTKFKVAEIVQAHESRICCSQLSPDGTTVATVGGDENLKFYKVFEPRRRARKTKAAAQDVMSLFGRSSSTLGEEHLVAPDEDGEDTTASAKRRTSEFLIR